MPKTRKKRGKKVNNNDSDKFPELLEIESNDNVKDFIEPGSESHERTEMVSENFSNLSESDLKRELETELKRLQDEYNRQKKITQELERNWDRVQDDGSLSIPVPKSSREVSDVTVKNKLSKGGFTEYPDPLIKPNLEQQFQSDFEFDRRFTVQLENLKADIVNLREQLELKLNKEIITEFESDKAIIDLLTNRIKQFEQELQKFAKALNRTEVKLDAVLLDLGFHEGLDINKIPNYILVLVYETILNDITNRIKHVIGAPDTESAVNKILENVRSHTSGGELFRYEHNRIKMPDLKQYLDKKMISPKQIHLTFNSIVNRLIEYIPGYAPKNFKAMIKIMSQEYAVEHVNKLEENFDKLLEEFGDLKTEMDTFNQKQNAQIVTKQDFEENLKKLNDQIFGVVESIDSLPKTLEKTLIDLVTEKFESRLAELNLEKTLKEEKDDKPKSEDIKPFFSKGVIELGEEEKTTKLEKPEKTDKIGKPEKTSKEKE